MLRDAVRAEGDCAGGERACRPEENEDVAAVDTLAEEAAQIDQVRAVEVDRNLHHGNEELP